MIVNGTTYHDETPQAVVDTLERNRLLARNGTPKRIKIHLGDAETGRDWCELYDVEGTIGRSTGRIKVPLMIHNRRSRGGPALLDHCIVRIRESSGARRVLYQHPDYHLPGPVTVEPETEPRVLALGLQWRVLVGDQCHARTKTKLAAQRFAARLS